MGCWSITHAGEEYHKGEHVHVVLLAYNDGNSHLHFDSQVSTDKIRQVYKRNKIDRDLIRSTRWRFAEPFGSDDVASESKRGSHADEVYPEKARNNIDVVFGIRS
ncbi:Uncharacterized protein Fot_12174 [Forsythia ovata]|uniref:Uncharacterized protein n=1 Tax=Forsythia ovata TaxID=205694 RepID=A0ABD1WLT4_9LAMI